MLLRRRRIRCIEGSRGLLGIRIGGGWRHGLRVRLRRMNSDGGERAGVKRGGRGGVCTMGSV